MMNLKPIYPSLVVFDFIPSCLSGVRPLIQWQRIHSLSLTSDCDHVDASPVLPLLPLPADTTARKPMVPFPDPAENGALMVLPAEVEQVEVVDAMANVPTMDFATARQVDYAITYLSMQWVSKVCRRGGWASQ